jgi:TldD protein
MDIINRRSFLKNCGAGAGILIGSSLLMHPLLSSCSEGGKLPEDSSIFGLSKEDINKLLQHALSKGGDFSELFFEYRISNNLSLEEDLIKNSSESISLGVGVRVLKGKQTGYAFTNDLTFEEIKNSAIAAAVIATGNAKANNINVAEKAYKHQVYQMKRALSDQELKSKIELVQKANEAAKSYDSRIEKVTVNLADELQTVTIANSDGLLISDVRPQTRLNVVSTAADGDKRGTGFHSGGGRVGMEYYNNVKTPETIGKNSAEEALLLVNADNAPAGEYPVVLGEGQSGVMIHEAVGHPLEGDSNWKKQSIMADKLGQMVANDIVTIYDDATINDFRGSLNIDDEGTITENVMLIEKGKLVGYLNDRLSAQLLKLKANGHGRRQSYRHPPIPRMNNTILEKGEHTTEEIISSVKKGFYAKSYQGGMVDNTGKFTFSVNLGYLIEDGKITKPLKNATLIGSNIQILQNVDMIANDMGFFLGTCGKDGQSVPVTAGTPTLRISKMTVGGEA